MANTFKVLYRGAAATTSTTLYTVPSATTCLVNSILITNTAGTSGTYTILFNDVSIGTTVTIPANDSVIIEPKQVLATTNTIKGLASATTINFHISGLEIT